MSIQLLAEDGVWTWFHDPRAVYHNGKTYFSAVGHNGVMIWCLDHETEATTEFLLMPMAQIVGLNDHVVASIGIRPDGRILVAYSDHANGPMFTRISTNPEDIGSWSEPVAVGTLVTYPMLAYLSAEGTGQGRWFLTYRSNGRVFRTSDDGGATWSAETSLVINSPQRPYMKMWSNGVDTLHFTVTDGHPREFAQNSVYHFWYDAGTWRKSDGSPLGSPSFAPSALTKIYDGTTNRGWLWDVCADPDTGYPVVTFQARHSPLDIRYHYARWDGSAWVSHEVVSGGRTIYTNTGFEDDYGAGMMLNHDDPSIAYVCREISGVHEIERWTTSDGGATWDSEPITQESGAGVKNFRPWYIQGGPLEVIWCRGPYTTYTAFSTDIYGLPRSDAPTPSRRRAASIVGIF